MNYDLVSICARLASIERDVDLIGKITGDRQIFLDNIEHNTKKMNEHIKDLKLKIETLNGQIDELEKENRKLKEQLESNEQNKVIQELLRTIEDLQSKNNEMKNELEADPTKNYLARVRNEKIVKLLSEAFKYINEPTMINQCGMFM